MAKGTKSDNSEELVNAAPEPITETTTTAATTTKEEEQETEAPTMPPRPLSPFAQKQATLTEAFPGIDAKVVRAILIAAQGQLDPAFNGLLSLTDPLYEVDESQFEAPAAPAAAPPVPARNQVDEDAQLARRLADEERRGSAARRGGAGGVGVRPPQSRSSQNQEPVDDRSFFDDDLPQIKETFTKGFNETKDLVNGWFDNLRKKVDSPEPQIGGGGAGQYQQSQQQQQRGYRNNSSSAGGRRARFYDGEPDQIDVGGIKLSNNDFEDEADDLHNAPKLPARKPQTSSPPPTSGTAATAKKGIPLKSSQAAPAEDDAFLISDSDDEDKKKST